MKIRTCAAMLALGMCGYAAQSQDFGNTQDDSIPQIETSSSQQYTDEYPANQNEQTNYTMTWDDPSANSQFGQNADAAIAGWERVNSITNEHVQLLTDMAGEWRTTVTYWMGADAAAVSAQGSAKAIPMMIGRFVSQEFSGTLNNKVFSGFGITGYNNFARRYESTWADSTSNTMLFLTGDRVGNTINWTGSTTDPFTGQPKSVRAVTNFENRDTMTYTMYETASDGREFRSFEVRYERQIIGRLTTPVETPLQNIKQPKPWQNGNYGRQAENVPEIETSSSAQWGDNPHMPSDWQTNDQNTNP